MTWQQDFTEQLNGAGYSLEASSVEHFTAVDTNHFIEWLRDWWGQAYNMAGLQQVLSVLPQVPAAMLTISGLDTYRAAELLRRAPADWTLGRLIETLDEKWRAVTERWGGVDHMTTGDHATQAAS